MSTAGRIALGYVVAIDGAVATVNMHNVYRGQVASHHSGVAHVGQPGDLLVASVGAELLVLRIRSLQFAEAKEAHRSGVGTSRSQEQPLRQITAHVVGSLARDQGAWEFSPDDRHVPPLGSSIFPIASDEFEAVYLPPRDEDDRTITLGTETRHDDLSIDAGINELLSRHAAVLGATGQGKTHFVAAILQQLADLPQARIVIFDINGEYRDAFSYLGDALKISVAGGTPAGADDTDHHFKIPYYALGRQGLLRLLLPSERTQLPALQFAIERLKYLAADNEGARLASSTNGNVFFDDCRQGGAQAANTAMIELKNNTATPATVWPHMRALSCVAADWYVLSPGRNGVIERNSFNYGHIQSMVSRIDGLIRSDYFSAIVDVNGGAPSDGNTTMSIEAEARALVRRLFDHGNDETWRVHVIDLSRLVEDLMPFVLGAVLEMYAADLFRRGATQGHPTLLVLEEAHHYLRSQREGDEMGAAYERLAKEGRKFNLSLLVSTQRPSELSTTVLSQCGTWAVFRLTNEQDQKAVRSAAEHASDSAIRQIAGLRRGEAVVFGNAVPLPVRVAVKRPRPDHVPRSLDAPFNSKWSDQATQAEGAMA